MKTIAVIGLGGVGGYFGYKFLTQKSRHNIKIVFVARGASYQVIAEKGLTLLSAETEPVPLHPDALFSTLSAVADTDAIIVCVKEYDLENICQQLKTLVSDTTIILPLMNGVDIYERIRRVIDQGMVLPACVYVASHIHSPGVIEHKGNAGKIFIGQDPRGKESIPVWLVELFAGSRIDATFLKDASVPIWMKFLFISPFGLVTARYDVSIGEVLQDPQLREQAKGIMEEIAKIAQKKGIALPDDAIKQTFQKAATFPFDATTSLRLDIGNNKKGNELPLFATSVLNYGREFGIATKNTERIYADLLAIVSRKITP